MKHVYTAKSISDLRDVAQEITQLLENKKINLLLFYGSMGAGKTTLIREMCSHMGIEDSVTSPTFAIVNEYVSYKNRTLYHFDLYRIEKIQELYDIGFEDYFFSDDLCLIEWPERITTLLEELESSLEIAKLEIVVDNKENRHITLTL